MASGSSTSGGGGHLVDEKIIVPIDIHGSRQKNPCWRRTIAFMGRFLPTPIYGILPASAYEKY